MDDAPKQKPAKRPYKPRQVSDRKGNSPQAHTARHRLFIDAYLSNGNNATQAAITAGYSPASANVRGHNLVHDPKIAKQIAVRTEQLLAKASLSAERWAKEMASIAHFDPRELYDTEGNMIPLHRLPEHVARAIASLDIDQAKRRGTKMVTTTTVKIHDKNTALANVGRHLGLFDEDNRQHTTPIQVNVILRG